MSRPPKAHPDDQAPRGVFGIVPAWLKGYTPGFFRADLIAAVTLAAYMIPAAIGDASLARLPPEAGLYACMLAGLVFWFLSGSRHTAVTVTSAISLLVGTSLGSLSGGDPMRFYALATCTALMVAAIAFAAWLVRAASLVRFVSETVLVGFKLGVALTLISTQLPKLLGVSAAHGGFWECASHLIHNLHEVNRASVMVGVAALAVLVIGKIVMPRRPVALVVVVVGILASAWMNLEASGVKVLGDVPQGFPRIGLPAVAWTDLNDILPLAMACFLLATVETAAIGRMFASKHGLRFDSNREMLAIAGSNLASGLGAGFPVSGGTSQSLVNESAGARTPMSGLIAALLILVVAVYFSGLLRDLPQPVLAAVVLMAAAGLVKIATLRRLWRVDRQELLIVTASLAGVLASGLLRGVLIGAIISLLLLIRRASRPHVAFLGKIPGSRRYSDLERHPDNIPDPGILIFRSEGSVLYFNCEHIVDTVVQRWRETSPRPQHVVCDLSASPLIDASGADAMLGLESELRSQGVRLHIVEARSGVRDRLRAAGLEERLGKIDRFRTVADAVEAIRSGASTPSHSSTEGVNP